ncbi:hypothetical protein CVT25_015206 [Psilocybe cyanescens]|uniref:Ubiquitin-like domain-containing protein n=1 Tax=Psilocybe cyanescens TaxID=93625 RepID=A0A409WRR4_PSICY|nr:hypothetical protein CVT25_015206 [Psilocybe cyanescens]
MSKTPSHIQKYSIAAGTYATLQRFGPSPPTREAVPLNSAMQKFIDYARQFLNLGSPMAGAIPVAGTPLKASIDVLLVVLNGVNIKSKNRLTADYMIQRLYRLEAKISAMPAASGHVQHQNDELIRKLNEISYQLKGMNVRSIFGSTDVQGSILDCMRDIDALERDYTLLALMRTEKKVEEIASQVPNVVQQAMIFVKDPTGREYKLLVEQCRSPQVGSIHWQFIGVLRWYFGQTDRRDKVLHSIIDQGAYDLYTETEHNVSQLTKWSMVRSGTRIVMGVILDQKQHGDRYQCPRPQCGKWNDDADVKEGWVDCTGCPSRFQITNVERRTKQSDSNSSKDATTRLTMSRDADDLLDLILIFHIRQQILSVRYTMELPPSF